MLSQVLTWVLIEKIPLMNALRVGFCEQKNRQLVQVQFHGVPKLT